MEAIENFQPRPGFNRQTPSQPTESMPQTTTIPRSANRRPDKARVVHRAPGLVVRPIAGHRYDRRDVSRIVALSIGIHLVAGLLIFGITCWLSLATYKNLIAHSSSEAASGPAAERPMTVELLAQNTLPPTPTPQPPTPTPAVPTIPLPTAPLATLALPTPSPVPLHPPTPQAETLRQLVKSDIVPSPQAAPKPAAKPRPRFTAANATGAGKNALISSAHVGTPGLPAPGYPPEALALREGGTVDMYVVFGPDGHVTSADVHESSGFSILDVSTRNFVYAHWKNTDLANMTIHVPVIYAPEDRPGGLSE